MLNALKPIAVLEKPVKLASSAKDPTAVLSDPVFAKSALYPRAVQSSPSVIAPKADLPIAVFLKPDHFRCDYMLICFRQNLTDNGFLDSITEILNINMG